MFKFYNANPKGLKVKDCVLRAYCTALDINYNTARNYLNRMKRSLGFDSYKDSEFVCELYKDYEKISFPAVAGKRRMNGKMFMEKYPKGTYVLRMAGHNTVCIDGDILDTWNCEEKCVYFAWKIN